MLPITNGRTNWRKRELKSKHNSVLYSVTCVSITYVEGIKVIRLYVGIEDHRVIREPSSDV